ncbi:MAG: hypothetical protein FWC79_02225 [Oscillospiraceae bacterium]|nr:hypothetical protein [Oscillospiraceae bacterium]
MRWILAYVIMSIIAVLIGLSRPIAFPILSFYRLIPKKDGKRAEKLWKLTTCKVFTANFLAGFWKIAEV